MDGFEKLHLDLICLNGRSFSQQLEGFHYNMSYIHLGDGEELRSSNQEVIMSSRAKLF